MAGQVLRKPTIGNRPNMTSKLYLLITLTFLSSGHLYGQTYNKQNTYLDALELANIKNSIPNSANKDTIYTINSFVDAFKKIVHKYGDDAELLDNPFLKNHLLGIYPPDTSPKVSSYIPGWHRPEKKEILKPIDYFSQGFAPASQGSVSWQASAINGVANFMAGRVKQEVLHASIDQIFKQIKTKGDSVLVKSIFPKTFRQIGALYGCGKSSYYTSDLLLLRQTAQIDIEQLPKNIIRNPEAIFPKIKNEPKMKDMMAFENYLVEYSQQGQSLERLLSVLAEENYSSDSTIYRILNVADLISQAMLNKEGNKDIWVNPLNMLPATASAMDNLEIRYFYGLLYQQLIQIPEFKYYLKSEDPKDIVSIAGKIQHLVRFVNRLNNTYNYIKSQKFHLKSPEEIVAYTNEVYKSIGFFITTLKNIPEINNHYQLHDTLIEISEKYITILESLIRQEYQQVIPLLVIEFGAYMTDEHGKSMRTIAFVSQLATIENADDMEALLNSYALPIGSSSIKRHSRFNITINSYVGLTAGRETAFGTLKKQTKGNIGLSAPIGISATFCKGYLTAFLSFIDLGSIVNQRLNNDTSAYSNLKFEHFFTPGMGLFFNHPKLPVTAGFHFNYIPNLRTIKYEHGGATITESNRSVTRINLSFLVDIPLYTIYNREKAK